MPEPLLRVRNLALEVRSQGAWRKVLHGIDFELEAGSICGLVGASGAGKTLTAMAIMSLLPEASSRTGGRIELEGQDLMTLSAAEKRRLRGERIAMVFQEPATALNPVLSIGYQVTESIPGRRSLSRDQVRIEVDRLLDLVALPGTRREQLYPHELSGGQRQRVMIAMALAGSPQLLIADEPTTALDVTVQAQILSLLQRLNRELDLSILLITHDLAVVSEFCDHAIVLEQGRIVEQGAVDEVIRAASQPSAFHRVGRAPGPATAAAESEALDGGGARNGRSTSSLVEARGVTKVYRRRPGVLQHDVREVVAVDGVDLTVEAGETLALVGESGGGKTTLAHCLVRLIDATSGEVFFDGVDLASLTAADLRRQRAQFQLVFQDAGSALDPRSSVGRAIAEPLEIHTRLRAAERMLRARELMHRVGLPPELAQRMPHELSSGQKQRVGIARALATEPRLLVADEPVSALDVTTRNEILALLERLRRELDLAILFIGHDLSVVASIADRIAVLYCGRIVEIAPTQQLLTSPLHPYSVSLLSSAPGLDCERLGHRMVLGGEPADPARPPSGCRFHPRCPIAEDHCRVETPSLVGNDPRHRVACYLPGQMRPVTADGVRVELSDR